MVDICINARRFGNSNEASQKASLINVTVAGEYPVRGLYLQHPLRGTTLVAVAKSADGFFKTKTELERRHAKDFFISDELFMTTAEVNKEWPRTSLLSRLFRKDKRQNVERIYSRNSGRLKMPREPNPKLKSQHRCPTGSWEFLRSPMQIAFEPESRRYRFTAELYGQNMQHTWLLEYMGFDPRGRFAGNPEDSDYGETEMGYLDHLEIWNRRHERWQDD